MVHAKQQFHKSHDHKPFTKMKAHLNRPKRKIHYHEFATEQFTEVVIEWGIYTQ